MTYEAQVQAHNRAASASWPTALVRLQAAEIERLQAEIARLREMLGLPQRRSGD